MIPRSASTVAKRAARHGKVASIGAIREYVVPQREMNFMIKEVHEFDKHYEKLGPIFEDCHADMDTVDMVIDETVKLCHNELEPLNQVADTEGCVWKDEVTTITPKGFKEAYDIYVESGWQGLSFPPQYGGQGMPMSMALIQSEMIAAANWTWLMFPGLSKGAINTIYAHCTDELKDKWLPPLVSGEFTGTMCLTEPQCGSDLGQVSTKAEPQPDGTYKISGTKIFISCGDHDMVDNIVHCVLARLPGAPEGTKGISLFLVPKKKMDDDGNVGELNNVGVSRIENKMGCHGSPTCQVEFEEAEGYLIGTENRGLNHMFTFINTSRVGTAVQGVAAAELAFQNSLWYAKERGSMRALSGTKQPEKVADPIIYHPSVRTMLLTQKCISEGGRSMVYECAKMADYMMRAEVNGDHAEAHRLDERLGFLTPILKGFLTEAGKEAADLGIQVYGGHGYIKDNKAEQVYRDVRIAPVWEGTTQIQALDLLGRKIMLQKLKPITEHCNELYKLCWKHMFDTSALGTHARSLMRHTMEWHAMTYMIGFEAKSNKEWISSTSVDYLMYSGYVTLAAHWLQMEAVANQKLKEGGTEEEEFYKAKIQTSAFMFDYLLPRTRGHKANMWTPIESITDMKSENFSFDHSR